MALYRLIPNTLAVTTEKASYTPNEDVVLLFQAAFERKGPGITAYGAWQTHYEIWVDGLHKFTRDSSHSITITPWEVIDQAKDGPVLGATNPPLRQSIGRLTAGPHNVEVRVSASG